MTERFSNSYEKTLLPAGSTILDALKIIDDSSLQIALVVDENRKLVGTVTDGDIRRGILNGISLEEDVSKVMNAKPFTITSGVSKEDGWKIMAERKFHHLPVVDEKGCVTDLLRMDKLALEAVVKSKSQGDVSVVLMLGGQGSRLMPLTEDTPKPMIEVGGRPLLETIVTNFVQQGFKKFYFSVNYKAEIIQESFGEGSDFGAEITYIDENKPMGTAGALGLLPDNVSKTLIVMNGDILTSTDFRHLVDFHQQNTAVATMCVREYQQQVPYGVIENSGTKLQSITEKPSQTYFVNAGIYVVDKQVLEHVPNDQYLDMPDLFTKLDQINQESAVFPIREYWVDIGNIQDLERARADYNDVFTEKLYKAQ